MRRYCSQLRMLDFAQQQFRAVLPIGKGNNGRGRPQGGQVGNQGGHEDWGIVTRAKVRCI